MTVPDRRGGVLVSNTPPPQSPYPPQGYPPPGYAPPKKRHTARNIVIVLVVLAILIVGGCLALLAGAVNEADKVLTEEEERDEPRTIAEGEAFTHDDFEVAAGWKVGREVGGVTITGLRVTNTLDESRTALLTFRFYKGNENLAEVECSSNRLQAGEVSKMDCFSFDSGFPRGYSEIKVSDMW